MEQSDVKKFENYCIGFMVESAGADEETEENLKTEIAIINTFCELVRDGIYEVMQSEPVQEALQKSREDIQAYLRQLQNGIDKYKNQIQNYDNQEYILHDKNQEIRFQRYQKEEELSKLGFLDGAKKKELQAEIKQLKPVEMPNFDEKREPIKKKIEFVEANMKPFQESMKGLTFYQMECERHFATIEKQAARNRPKQKAVPVSGEELQDLDVRVQLGGKTIAAFTDKDNASRFVEVMREKLMMEFGQKQINDYIEAHPFNQYGGRTRPGDIPQKELYPAYQAYSERLEKELTIKGGKKAPQEALTAVTEGLNIQNLKDIQKPNLKPITRH